jgi:hypothetical protein
MNNINLKSRRRLRKNNGQTYAFNNPSILYLILRTQVNETKGIGLLLIKSFRNQHMHYILISKSIATTYVSAFNKPSSVGQSFTKPL